MQRFDNIATKFLKLIPMSQPPSWGFFLDTNGRLGFAVLGKVVWAMGKPTVISADGAIDPHTSANYVVTKGIAAALTLAAPTVTVDDGVEIFVTSNTAFAHVITATGLLQTGTAAVNTATFAAQKGAGVGLMAYQGKWNVISAVGVTFA